MIIKNNEDLLRRKCEDVKEEEIGDLIATLERELDHSARIGEIGIGLAASQCGILKKAAIVRVGDVKLNLINAELDIDKLYDCVMFKSEGCLSFPGRTEDTMRYQEIVLKNNLVYPYNFVAKGLAAVVCQHEIEHYYGGLFFDHIAKKVQRVRPNELCPCKSGKKFKRCCGK